MIGGMVLRSLLHVATQKPEYELADVLRLHLGDYLQKYHCTATELRALTAIMNCRTALLGGHIRICDGCGQWQISYNSCKNRHCPKCGAFEQAQSFGSAQEQACETGGVAVAGAVLSCGLYDRPCPQ